MSSIVVNNILKLKASSTCTDVIELKFKEEPTDVWEVLSQNGKINVTDFVQVSRTEALQFTYTGPTNGLNEDAVQFTFKITRTCANNCTKTITVDKNVLPALKGLFVASAGTGS